MGDNNAHILFNRVPFLLVFASLLFSLITIKFINQIISVFEMNNGLFKDTKEASSSEITLEASLLYFSLVLAH
jgi:hypothetical protein